MREVVSESMQLSKVRILEFSFSRQSFSILATEAIGQSFD